MPFKFTDKNMNLPKKEYQPPKNIQRISELPSGKILDDKFLGLQKYHRDNIIFYMANVAQKKESNKIIVWAITTHWFSTKKSMDFLELRKRLSNNGYQLAASIIAETHLIQTLYDNQIEYESSGTVDIDDADNELLEYFNEMVEYAVKESVSDIHLEKRSTRSIVRMRKHGQLFTWKELSNNFAGRMGRVSYNVFSKNQQIIFREDIPQSSSINTQVAGKDVKLRFQSTPAYPDGFDIILRVLPIGDDDEGAEPLHKLGYEKSQERDLLFISSKPVGALIIAGTTGSGKSTTLKNLLMMINHTRNYRCKIYTIEDPPEYRIPGVTQIPVVRTDGMTESPFLEPIKATMRGDPDILMIGEIRDEYTSDGLEKMTQSGHQVLTTTHTPSAIGIVERLVNLGTSPLTIGSPEFLNGLVYQKLIPLSCKKCAVSFNDLIRTTRATEKDLALAKRLEKVADLSRHEILIKGDGCEHCQELGIVGRTVCAEIIVPDYKMIDHFKNMKIAEARYYWRSQSDHDDDSENMTGKTALEHALLKMRRGDVCPYVIEEWIDKVDDSYNDWQMLKKQMEE